MTTKISPYKMSRLLALHFQGYSQVQVAQKLGIDQSTVSLYIAKFGMQSQGMGLMAAAKEAGIMEIITALHSLAAELQASKLTAEEAKLGLQTRLKLEKYGVAEELYPQLIQSAAKMKDEGFLDAALKLASLEKAIGMGYAEIIHKYETAAGQLEQKSGELAALKAAMIKQQSELKVIEGKRKDREKEYTAFFKQTGMNMQRLQLVEIIAVLFKKLGIKDSELEAYIQRQKELDSCGIDINLFGKIASKAEALTSADGGKQLLDMLAEYGNLQATVDKLGADKKDLANQVSDLSEKVKEKNQLVAEIGKLTSDRNALVAVVKDLDKKSQIKEQLAYQIKSLENDRQAIESDIKSLQNQKLALEEDIVATKAKLTELQPLKSQHEGLTRKIAELNKEFAEKSKQFELFQAFLGFLQDNTIESIEKFIKLAPATVQWAKEGKYSTELIKKRILEDLTMGQLNLYSCMTCNARFFVDSAPKWKDKFSCPNCKNNVAVMAKTDAYDALSQMVAKPIPGQVITIRSIKH